MLTRNWGKEYFNTPGGDINYSKYYKPQYGISLGEKKNTKPFIWSCFVFLGIYTKELKLAIITKLTVAIHKSQVTNPARKLGGSGAHL